VPERSDLAAAARAQQAVMLHRLQELVEAESPSADRAALNRCAGLLDTWFADVLHRRADRPVPSLPHLLWPAPDPAVLVLGHLDTVWPTGTLRDWPYTVDEHGTATGPGVFDMKAGLVQLLTALDLTAGRDHVSVLITCDEETGSATSRALIEAEATRAGTVLVCEPSADDGALKVARKGVATYQVKVAGRAAHAGLEPELGINAGVELAHQILALQQVADPAAGTTVTPTVAVAGTTANSVPETAQLTIDARAWTRAELDRVDTAVRALRPHLPDAALTVEGGINRYPLEPEHALGLYALARQAAHDVGLHPPDAVRSAGASDGNLTAALAIPTLDGLGAVGAHPHARSERVHTHAMPDRAALVAALVDRIVGADRQAR
jgi:glutamate carboxypeptidase